MNKILYPNNKLLLSLLIISVVYVLSTNKVFETEEEYKEATKDCLNWDRLIDLSQHPCGVPDLQVE